MPGLCGGARLLASARCAGVAAAAAAEVLLRRRRAEAVMAEEVRLSDDEARAYHATMAKLRAVRSMHEAVGMPGAGVFWDFKSQHALPGRLWQDHVPEAWRHELERDYTPAELLAARELTGIDRVVPAAPGERPRLVFLLGPPGAGKSSCLSEASKILDLSLDNFAVIDGDHLRSCHLDWKRRIDDDPVSGYRDCFQVFKRAQKKWRHPFDTLKVQLTTEALRDHKDIVLCDTKINEHILDHLRSENYEVILVGLVISQEESHARNMNRGQQIGRYGDSSLTAWRVCMDALRLLSQPGQSERVVIFDATDLTKPKIVFSRLHDRADMERLIDAHDSVLPAR